MILTNVCLLLIGFTVAKGRKFPDDFNFGFATAAHQIEGAWNAYGKGPNIWDNFSHRVPSPIANNETGDIACDSYHKYKEDVSLVAGLGGNMYRISVSWARILPNGYADEINEEGLQYYRNVIQEMLQYNISPFVTLYHWDLPQKLVDDGIDWTNPKLVDIFVDYARIVIKNLPEVKWWITLNEPKQICHYSYGTGWFAPGMVSDGLLEYQCSYVVVKAHAAVYNMYKKEFPNHKGKMTIGTDCQWSEPATNSEADLRAVDRQLQFECGIYLHPVFIGDWPAIFKERVAERSLAANYNESRLPSFSEEEIESIRGTHDYLAFNHYITRVVGDAPEGASNTTSYANDIRINASFYPSNESGSNGATLNAWGVQRMIKWLVEQYGNHEIMLTEVGLADNGSTLNDDLRISFLTDLYCYILDAREVDGANVVGIINWSIIDNFEWTFGYGAHFGAYYIDFNDPNRTRVPKKSTLFYKNLTSTKQIQCKSY